MNRLAAAFISILLYARKLADSRQVRMIDGVNREQQIL